MIVALHYAAEAGRGELCQALLSRVETFLTLVDQQRHTPCDLADTCSHAKLAAHLGARAILYRDPYGMDDELLAQIIQNSSGEFDEDNTGTKLVSPFAWFTTYDMDQVQVERERRVLEALSFIQKIVNQRSEGEKAVAKILGEPVKRDHPDLDIQNFRRVHAGHVERLLQYHGWDVKTAVIAFIKSPVKTFNECKLDVPALEQKGDEEKNEVDGEVTCLICCDNFSKESEEWTVLQTCAHGFCRLCLGAYIADTARSRNDGLVVKCPHHECMSPLDPEEVSRFSSDQKDFLQLQASSNNCLVTGSEMLRFCPHPDCGCVVKLTLPNFAKEAGLDDVGIFHLVGAVCARKGSSQQSPFLSYEGLDDPQYFKHEAQPRRAHRFCFSCGESHAHWPLNCDSLDEWKQEVATHLREVAGEDLNDDDFNGIAQKLWMKANTRPCPKCNVPIEKDQGCNHVSTFSRGMKD